MDDCIEISCRETLLGTVWYTRQGPGNMELSCATLSGLVTWINELRDQLKK